MKKFYENISALQKSVRWGEVNEARYFARQLMKDGTPGAVFNRLFIIAAEDVGLADPTLVVYVRRCLDNFEKLLKKYGVKKRAAFRFPKLCEAVDRAVIAAAVSFKSRLLPMISFATLYDIYTNEKFSGNVYSYFGRFVDSLHNNDEKSALYYAYITGIYLNKMDRLLSTIQKLGTRRNEFLIREWVDGYKKHDELLFLAGSVVILCRDLDCSHGEYKNAVSKYLSIPIKTTEIPDRAFDKHTIAGKRKGRGLKHFFNEAATVKNERFPNDWELAGRSAYYRADKQGLGKAAKVIDATKTKLQAQVALVTV